ncbi:MULTISPECIES: cell wall hydrolase [Hungatella]|uniref:N-acetylmuramoyl-L-alanine amidase n=2 Tax=Hungatella TaxID=1649459 RepID=A0A2V3XZW0_9FIRM|nr:MULTISPECIES: cell wall hydrolase [Hungatella]MBC5711204.1 cell wall hydrolase [Hungatella hominis]PXX51423.1 N-acetylmuramoyl-L-alanine amidase [Hungatella effluvii]
MLTLRSILQHICQFFRGLAVKATKRMYRSSAVFMAGAAVITVVAFTSTGFGSGGKNALTAFAETPGQETAAEEEDAEEEEPVTEAKVQVQLTEIKKQGQLLAGNLLEKEVQQKQEIQQESKEELERINEQIVMDAKIKALEAEENARQKALEEERRREEEKKAASRKAVSDDDYQVLLRIVQAEAGVCDEKGKILVANVVLNRVKSQEFPDSVRSVVYEPSQFSPVSDGSINSVKVTEETRECVNRALEGEDYSDGALYFMNRRGSRSGAVSWFDSHLTYLFRHQNHEFFK